MPLTTGESMACKQKAAALAAAVHRCDARYPEDLCAVHALVAEFPSIQEAMDALPAEAAQRLQYLFDMHPMPPANAEELRQQQAVHAMFVLFSGETD